jgi:serine/threonine protein phosphatase PrpC
MFDATSISSTQEVAPRSRRQGITAGHATHRGLVRSANEDDHSFALDIGFFVVADGVGGSPGGAVAARLATAAMISSLRFGARWKVGSDSSTPPPDEETATHSARMVAAAHQAHQMIYSYGVRNRCPGAATTMVALWIVGNKVLVANVGDSRAYRLEGDGLTLLSRDHSALQEYADRFGPVPEPTRYMLENIVTRVLGGHTAQAAEVELSRHAISGKEVFLLCTDGLSKVVSEREIALILASSMTPQEAADTLIDRANEAGGPDNVTCIVVQVERVSG